MAILFDYKNLAPFRPFKGLFNKDESALTPTTMKRGSDIFTENSPPYAPVPFARSVVSAGQAFADDIAARDTAKNVKAVATPAVTTGTQSTGSDLLAANNIPQATPGMFSGGLIDDSYAGMKGPQENTDPLYAKTAGKSDIFKNFGTGITDNPNTMAYFLGKMGAAAMGQFQDSWQAKVGEASAGIAQQRVYKDVVSGLLRGESLEDMPEAAILSPEQLSAAQGEHFKKMQMDIAQARDARDEKVTNAQLKNMDLDQGIKAFQLKQAEFDDKNMLTLFNKSLEKTNAEILRISADTDAAKALTSERKQSSYESSVRSTINEMGIKSKFASPKAWSLAAAATNDFEGIVKANGDPRTPAQLRSFFANMYNQTNSEELKITADDARLKQIYPDEEVSTNTDTGNTQDALLKAAKARKAGKPQ